MTEWCHQLLPSLLLMILTSGILDFYQDLSIVLWLLRTCWHACCLPTQAPSFADSHIMVYHQGLMPDWMCPVSTYGWHFLSCFYYLQGTQLRSHHVLPPWMPLIQCRFNDDYVNILLFHGYWKRDRTQTHYFYKLHFLPPHALLQLGSAPSRHIADCYSVNLNPAGTVSRMLWIWNLSHNSLLWTIMTN